MEEPVKFKFKMRLPIKATRLGDVVYVVDGKDEFLIKGSIRSLYDKIKLPEIKYSKIGFVVKDFTYLIWYDEKLLLATPRKVGTPINHVDNRIVAGAVYYKDGRIVGDRGLENKREYKLYYYSKDLTSRRSIFGESFYSPIAFIGKIDDYVVVVTYGGEIYILSVEKIREKRYRANSENVKYGVGSPTAREIRKNIIVLGTKKDGGSIFVYKYSRYRRDVGPGDEETIGRVVKDIAVLDKGEVLEIYAKTENKVYKLMMYPDRLYNYLEKTEEIDGLEEVKHICSYKGKLVKIYEDRIEYDGKTYYDRVLAYHCAEDGLYILGKEDGNLYVRKVFGEPLKIDHDYYYTKEIDVSYKGKVSMLSKEVDKIIGRLRESLEDERILRENFEELLNSASALGLKTFEDYLNELEKRGYIRRIEGREYEVLIPHNDFELIKKIAELKKNKIMKLAKEETLHIFNIIKGRITEALRKIDEEIKESESINVLNKREEIYEEAKKRILEELASLIMMYKGEEEDIVKKSKDVYRRLFDIEREKSPFRNHLYSLHGALVSAYSAALTVIIIDPEAIVVLIIVYSPFGAVVPAEHTLRTLLLV